MAHLVLSENGHQILDGLCAMNILLLLMKITVTWDIPHFQSRPLNAVGVNHLVRHL